MDRRTHGRRYRWGGGGGDTVTPTHAQNHNKTSTEQQRLQGLAPALRPAEGTYPGAVGRPSMFRSHVDVEAGALSGALFGRLAAVTLATRLCLPAPLDASLEAVVWPADLTHAQAPSAGRERVTEETGS